MYQRNRAGVGSGMEGHDAYPQQNSPYDSRPAYSPYPGQGLAHQQYGYPDEKQSPPGSRQLLGGANSPYGHGQQQMMPELTPVPIGRPAAPDSYADIAHREDYADELPSPSDYPVSYRRLFVRVHMPQIADLYSPTHSLPPLPSVCSCTTALPAPRPLLLSLLPLLCPLSVPCHPLPTASTLTIPLVPRRPLASRPKRPCTQTTSSTARNSSTVKSRAPPVSPSPRRPTVPGPTA